MANNVQNPTSTNTTLAIKIQLDLFDISDDTAMTTAMITKNQDNFCKMTLEEQMQRYDDEQFGVEDREKKQPDQRVSG